MKKLSNWAAENKTLTAVIIIVAVVLVYAFFRNKKLKKELAKKPRKPLPQTTQKAQDYVKQFKVDVTPWHAPLVNAPAYVEPDKTLEEMTNFTPHI